jgi:hypothetical protein
LERDPDADAGLAAVKDRRNPPASIRREPALEHRVEMADAHVDQRAHNRDGRPDHERPGPPAVLALTGVPAGKAYVRESHDGSNPEADQDTVRLVPLPADLEDLRFRDIDLPAFHEQAQARRGDAPKAALGLHPIQIDDLDSLSKAQFRPELAERLGLSLRVRRHRRQQTDSNADRA